MDEDAAARLARDVGALRTRVETIEKVLVRTAAATGLVCIAFGLLMPLVPDGEGATGLAVLPLRMIGAQEELTNTDSPGLWAGILLSTTAAFLTCAWVLVCAWCRAGSGRTVIAAQAGGATAAVGLLFVLVAWALDTLGQWHAPTSAAPLFPLLVAVVLTLLVTSSTARGVWVNPPRPRSSDVRTWLPARTTAWNPDGLPR